MTAKPVLVIVMPAMDVISRLTVGNDSDLDTIKQMALGDFEQELFPQKSGMPWM